MRTSFLKVSLIVAIVGLTAQLTVYAAACQRGCHEVKYVVGKSAQNVTCKKYSKPQGIVHLWSTEAGNAHPTTNTQNKIDKYAEINCCTGPCTKFAMIKTAENCDWKNPVWVTQKNATFQEHDEVTAWLTQAEFPISNQPALLVVLVQ